LETLLALSTKAEVETPIPFKVDLSKEDKEVVHSKEDKEVVHSKVVLNFQ
jgi:hypothetical protein